MYAFMPCGFFSLRSGGSVVDNTLDYQSRDRKVDPPLLRPFGWDFKATFRLRIVTADNSTLRIAYRFISNLWQLRQGVDSLAQW